MEIIPHLRILQFLKQLGKESKNDKFVVREGDLVRHFGSEEVVKNYLITEGFIGKDLSIADKGELFLKKYSGCIGYMELLLTDYPFIIGTFISGILGGIIGGFLLHLLTK